MKKAYDNIQLSANIVTNVLLDKFALRAFNRLVYDREISGLLVASYLLRLSDDYTLSNNLKFINLSIPQKRFSEFALHFYGTRSTVNNVLQLRRQTLALPKLFDHYCCGRSRLQHFCLFMYIRVISIYLQKIAISSDIKFEFNHPK